MEISDVKEFLSACQEAKRITDRHASSSQRDVSQAYLCDRRSVSVKSVPGTGDGQRCK